MQPMMAAYYPTNVTTDHIQQYLDENKSLILKIVESQNSGKLSECAENQARLQRNLMYLAAIADSQPQPPNIHSQYASGGIIQAGAHYLQHQQAAAAAQQQQQQQQMTPQSLMAARSASMLYSSQQAYQSQQQQQQALLGGGGGLMLQGEPHGFPDFVRSSSSSGNGGDGLRGLASGSKQDHGEGRDGGETLYLKSAEDGN